MLKSYVFNIKNKIMKKIIFIALIMFLIIITVLIFDIGRKDDTEPMNFKECLLKGYLILESFPRQCQTPKGKFFVEDSGNNNIVTDDKSNLIKVDAPLPNDNIKSPLLVSGVARGYWFFEASFPISLVDDDNNEIASGIAQADGEWMTTEFVPFKSILNFDKSSTTAGRLIFKKDNPSGLSENDDELIIPIVFD